MPQPRTDVAGWEGFFDISTINDEWLAEKRIPLRAEVVRGVMPRVAKLSVAYGRMEAPSKDLDIVFEHYCKNAAVRAWNEGRCAGLQKRQCASGQCSYEHFGNCSGLLLANGVFLTAAHCVESLRRQPALAAASRVVLPGLDDGSPARKLRIKSFVLGKKDFDHEWVTEAENPVDVAAVGIDTKELAQFPIGPPPKVGDVAFIVGYPRAERRSRSAREKNGYELVYGTPSVSFGRIAEANTQNHAFCSTDGRQEHWAIVRDCPERRRKTAAGFAGVLTYGAFLLTTDTVNGYSGAPIFDSRGRLIGVNSTCAGGVDPQDLYTDRSRAVAIKAEIALKRLRLAP